MLTISRGYRNGRQWVTRKFNYQPHNTVLANCFGNINVSYAAGVGSGNLIDKGCSRYDSAYPNLINLSLEKSVKDIDFTFTACTGAVNSDVYTQVGSLTTGQQLITISSGGNDAGFFDILNACIYRW